MQKMLAALVMVSSITGSQLVIAQSQPQAMHSRGRVDLLRQFDDSLEELASRVSPAVVEILVSGYGPVERANDEVSSGANTALIGRQHILGSGVIVDPNGYIVTNAHVVDGAQRIRVMLSSLPRHSKSKAVAWAGKTVYDARVIGVHRETDLALLKIDANGLPFLPVDPTREVHQGQLVIALGSPEGLENSLTMGVVSSVARQPDPDRPMGYIQTDAPINQGSSGGPLVDVDGYLVGINTLILSSRGASQGIGFAIPARVVSFVYEKLRKNGHVDRSEIGATAQTITPLLAAGLDLPLNTGIIISDVSPQGPAESAGLRPKDIVARVDGWPIDTLPAFELSLYLHPADEVLTMEVLRGDEKHTLHIPVMEQKHETDRLVDMADPQKNLVSKLGLLAIEIDDKLLGTISDLRDTSGVIVAAKAAYGSSVNTGLTAGDVIHGVNGSAVTTLESLRAAVDRLKPGDAVVVQIERQDKLQYLAFELE
jgi:serine protease Do